MASKYVSVVSILVAVACAAAMLLACTQPWPQVEKCDPADSAAVCTAVKTCFEEHPASACRQYERVANQLLKPSPLLGPNGAANALRY
jgi:hypothetical protein